MFLCLENRLWMGKPSGIWISLIWRSQGSESLITCPGLRSREKQSWDGTPELPNSSLVFFPPLYSSNYCSITQPRTKNWWPASGKLSDFYWIAEVGEDQDLSHCFWKAEYDVDRVETLCSKTSHGLWNPNASIQTLAPLTLWPSASYLISLCLCFLIYKVKMLGWSIFKCLKQCFMLSYAFSPI